MLKSNHVLFILSPIYTEPIYMDKGCHCGFVLHGVVVLIPPSVLKKVKYRDEKAVFSVVPALCKCRHILFYQLLKVLSYEAVDILFFGRLVDYRV